MYTKDLQYAFLILENIKEIPMQPRQIAAREKLNPVILSNVAGRLRKHGLIKNTSGQKRQQYWCLGKAEITMQEVIDAIKATSRSKGKHFQNVYSFKSLKYIQRLDDYHAATRVV